MVDASAVVEDPVPDRSGPDAGGESEGPQGPLGGTAPTHGVPDMAATDGGGHPGRGGAMDRPHVPGAVVSEEIVGHGPQDDTAMRQIWT